MTRRFATYLLVAVLPAAAYESADSALAPANDSIDRNQMKADVYFLASSALRGRLTGTAEYYVAAEFLQSRFQRLGLRGAGHDGSFFHRFDLIRSRLAEGNRLQLKAAAGHERIARLREEFVPTIFSATARAQGELVFAGFGIRAPKLDWDDYAGDAVKGRIVVALEGDPSPHDPKSRFDGLVNSEYGNALRKTLAAQHAGAIGILLVSAESGRASVDAFLESARSYWPDQRPRLERFTLAAYAKQIQIPAAIISPQLAAWIFQRAGMDFAAAAAKAEQAPTAAFSLRAQAQLDASVARETVADRNVIAFVEGSDPQRKSECVIVSAHYDHNGAAGDDVYPGADDNASGTAALLEIAEAYALAAAQGRRPKRSVLFAAWGSEERCCGPLLGSWAWVEDPLWPLEKTVAVLNMDMIGRNEEVPDIGDSRFRGLPIQSAAANTDSVNLIGYSYSPDLVSIIQAANRRFRLRLQPRYDNNRSNHLRRSDQWPFLNRETPAIWFHTGLHPDYHTIYDRPERIDYVKMERIARLVHQASWEIAQREEPVRFLRNRKTPDPD